MNRGRIETLNIILTISTRGIKKTHILYKAGLSYAQLKKYLDVLISKGLLAEEHEADGARYRTTDKGLKFIEEYKKIQSILDEDNRLSTLA
jgi:predicted transcriptional regulator